MKIVEKNKKLKQVTFDKLEQGDCFYKEGDYFIKIEDNMAVCLCNGELIQDIENDTNVTFIEAEVHILDKKPLCL